MKNTIGLFIIFFLLNAGSCDPDGHSTITAVNKSPDSVIFAIISGYGGDTNKINLGGVITPPEGKYIWKIRGSYEDEITEKNPFEFYVVNPHKYNQPGVFYPRDSMYVKNEILKKYTLTLRDLDSANWKITYTGK
ncbi:MAG: hypothetical protein L6Q77_15450 [Bacteroidetes bacterium]|nr:hypothetical protein [Bacteroidota bacterium]